MDFPRFYFLVLRKTLYLPSLSSLTNDPWEGLPPLRHFDPDLVVLQQEVAPDDVDRVISERLIRQADLHDSREKFEAYVRTMVQIYRAQREKIFVSCWHMNEAESEALWKIYGGQGCGIAVRSSYESLGAAISSTQPVYGGQVQYLDETKQALGADNLFYNCIWKRRSFEHEREFRVVVATDEPAKGIPISVDLDRLVEEVVVHPQAEEWFVAIVTDLVKTVGINARVHRSRLLGDPNYGLADL
jgi:hypothetical protein